MGLADGSVLRVKRNEFKHMISYEDAVKLQKRLSCLLSLDEFSQDGSYRVKSLYFDSINNVDFVSKINGEDIKKKIRLRIYDEDAEIAKLELKAKEGIYQEKTSVLLSRQDAKAVCGGDFSILLHDPGEEALRLYTKLVLGCYAPAAIIEYDRLAFMYPEYNTRITFDSYVRSSELNLDLYDRNIAMTPILTDAVILEVKYNDKLLGFISETLRHFQLTNIAASKYCTGRKIFLDYII